MRQRLVASLFFLSLLECSAYAAQCTTTPKLAFGNAHAVILTDDCLVWVWGLNDYGELGNAKLKASTEPIQVTPLRNVFDVAASSNYSLALLGDGRVVIWGNFDT